ncbi:hypothetical protein [Salicola sp. Rm-C-2C1-2]|uniref:hypothetical protein n=1 Tax=Salicola sp. Rm-C-2C1-2 TaxID=3141321 RepID=UPI0032E43671
MSEQVEIKDRDRTYVRKVIGAFINEGMAARISPINEEVVRVVGKMVAESKDCSEWMDYVPKPVAPCWRQTWHQMVTQADPETWQSAR